MSSVIYTPPPPIQRFDSDNKITSWFTTPLNEYWDVIRPAISKDVCALSNEASHTFVSGRFKYRQVEAGS